MLTFSNHRVGTSRYICIWFGKMVVCDSSLLFGLGAGVMVVIDGATRVRVDCTVIMGGIWAMFGSKLIVGFMDEVGSVGIVIELGLV